MNQFRLHVDEFNRRKLTFPEDIQGAFAGITTLLSRSFYGGFLFGLPLLFFDIALCWQPFSCGIRRQPSTDLSAAKASLPSWSWMGWETKGISWAFYPGRPKTISIVQWHSQNFDSSELEIIDGPQIVQALISEAQENEYVVPKGWKRFEYGPLQPPDRNVFQSLEINNHKYFFKHESEPGSIYDCPLPTREAPSIASMDAPLPPLPRNSLLYCRTRKATFHMTKMSRIKKKNGIIVTELYYQLQDQQSHWAGIIQSTAECWHYHHDETGQHLIPSDEVAGDLVIVCESYSVEGVYETFVEWEFEERPKGPTGSKYEYYNVLWVEWDDGIAYRKGCGRVMKSVCDALEPEWIDLTLG
ncbi:uncharacterized protein PAC_04078 [Phialocephala subalpina]|uniref:Heterokaryon incompatibility domain-containing protein n=1 Tax=Phialocephala subalpina TaxID=576137 RepID=A0A1L7WN44_9HELO|nr:uncharacterized protein PAC_04078 [Phialocephala subalpina]